MRKNIYIIIILFKKIFKNLEISKNVFEEESLIMACSKIPILRKTCFLHGDQTFFQQHNFKTCVYSSVLKMN